MAELTSFDGSGYAPLLRQLRIRNGVAKFTLTEAATLTARSPNFIDIDPNGTKVVTLPAEGDSDGLVFWIINSGGAGEDITLNDDSGSLVVTINEDEAAMVACDGTTWRVHMLTSVELSTLRVDTINEATSGSGVTVDGVLLKDSQVKTDVILEKTGAAGVTADGLRLKDATVKPVAGGSAFIDLTDTATGEADILLADARASAMQIREGANLYTTYVTTDSAEEIAQTQRTTTTDGVASGTVRVTGGRCFPLTAADSVDSSEIVQASGGQVAFDKTHSIPADTLKAGSTLYIRAVIRIATVLNGGANMDCALLLGGAAIITATDSGGGAAGTRCLIEAYLTFDAAPAAAVEGRGVSTAVWSDTVAVIGMAPLAAGAVPTFATDGALVVSATGESSAAGDGSGRIVLEQLYIRID